MIDTKNNIEMSEQRIDNWLYRVRLAKTRSISQRIIKDELGSIHEEFVHFNPIFIERVFKNINKEKTISFYILFNRNKKET